MLLGKHKRPLDEDEAAVIDVLVNHFASEETSHKQPPQKTHSEAGIPGELRCLTHQVKSAEGKDLRLRLKNNSLTTTEWMFLETSLQNIGFLKGRGGEGFLWRRYYLDPEDRLMLFKTMGFQYTAYFILFEWLLKITNYKLTLPFWRTYQYCFLGTRTGLKVDDEKAKVKTYRFAGNKISLTTTKQVSGHYHDSLLQYNLVSSPARSGGGLDMFSFPGPPSIQHARMSLLLKLKENEHVYFCKQQMFGTRREFNVFVFEEIVSIVNYVVEAACSTGCAARAGPAKKLKIYQMAGPLLSEESKEKLDAVVVKSSLCNEVQPHQFDALNSEKTASEIEMQCIQKEIVLLSEEKFSDHFANLHFKKSVYLSKLSNIGLFLVYILSEAAGVTDRITGLHLFSFFVAGAVLYHLDCLEDLRVARKRAGLMLLTVTPLFVIGLIWRVNSSSNNFVLMVSDAIIKRPVYVAIRSFYFAFSGIDWRCRVLSSLCLICCWLFVREEYFVHVNRWTMCLVAFLASVFGDVSGTALFLLQKSKHLKFWNVRKQIIPSEVKAGEEHDKNHFRYILRLSRSILLSLLAAHLLYSYIWKSSVSVYRSQNPFPVKLQLIVFFALVTLLVVSAFAEKCEDVAYARLVLGRSFVGVSIFSMIAIKVLVDPQQIPTVRLPLLLIETLLRVLQGCYMRLVGLHWSHRYTFTGIIYCHIAFVMPIHSFPLMTQMSAALVVTSGLVFGEMAGELIDHLAKANFSREFRKVS